VIGNDRNARVRVPLSENYDLLEYVVKIITGMDNKIERKVEFGFAWGQTIGAGYRS